MRPLCPIGRSRIDVLPVVHGRADVNMIQTVPAALAATAVLFV